MNGSILVSRCFGTRLRAGTTLGVLTLTFGAIFAAAFTVGCASDPETHALIEQCGGAASVGCARNAVHWRRLDLQSRTDLAASEKARLLAECDALDAQADALEAAIDASPRDAAAWQADAEALDARVDAFLFNYPGRQAAADEPDLHG